MLLSARASRAAATMVPEDDEGIKSDIRTTSPLLFRVRPASSMRMEPRLALEKRTETVCSTGMVLGEVDEAEAGGSDFCVVLCVPAPSK